MLGMIKNKKHSSIGIKGGSVHQACLLLLIGNGQLNDKFVVADF